MCETDPLVVLPVERWSELQGAFKADWPRGIAGYEALEIQRKWKNRVIDFDFTVYCPFGDVNNGMVVINEKDGYYEVIILCPKDDTEELAKALRNTKLINWNKEVIVPFAPQNVIDCLDRIIPDMHIEVTDVKRMVTLILEEATFEDMSLPPNITFGLVTLENLDLVNSTWPRRYPESPSYFQFLINSNCGYGLYHGNDLISWVFYREVGNLQHMYTIEEYRGKGYGELLLKLAGKIWMRGGRPIFGYCYKDNIGALKLYKKLRCYQAESVTWYFLRSNIK